MRWLRCLGTIGVLALLPSMLVAWPATAAPAWTSPEVLGFGGDDVRMDVGSSGDAVAAWSSEKGVKASYRPAGKDWQRSVVVERGASGVLDVFVDRRGVARVVWWDADVLGLATRTLTGRWRVDPAAAGTGGGCCWSSTPNVAADEDGNLVAMWQDINDLAGTYSNFYWRTPAGRWTSVGGGTTPYGSAIVVHEGSATLIDGGGELRESSGRVNRDLKTSQVIRSDGDFGRPVLAANHRGDQVLAVVEGMEDPETAEVDGSLLVLTKSAGGGWTTVLEDGGDGVSFLSVAINDDGDLAVAYRRPADGAVVVRLGTLGGPMGGEHAVTTGVRVSGLSAAMAPDGAVSVTWSQDTFERRAVFAATKTVGRSWSSPTRLGTQVPSGPYSEPGHPSVLAYPNGMFTTVFADGTAARWADHFDDRVAPSTRMRAPVRDFTRSTAMRVAWDGTDELSRPDLYDVRYRVAGRGGKLGRWHRWLTDTERVARSFTGRPGRTYCFAARTQDRVGNVGRWGTQRCSTTPLDDRSFAVRSRDWDRVHNRRAYRDTLTVADRRHQTLRLGGVSATSIRLMVRTCQRCGTVVVEHAGQRVGTVDTSGRVRNRIVLVEKYDRRRTGSLVIRTRGGGGVQFDGVIASR